jgi:hypothetical protein
MRRNEMRRKTVMAITLFAMALLFPREVIYAQEEKQGEVPGEEKAEEFSGEGEKAKEPSAEEKEKGAVSELVNFLKSIHPGFYIDFAYEYNFNRPDNGLNQFRVFDTEDNEFNLHLFQLSFRRIPTMEGGLLDLVGFGAKLDFGEDADIIASTGLGDPDDEFDLQEAYIHILAPIGNGIDIFGGKFVTLAGAEVIESKDDFNYSRSFLFGFAIPFTHTGIRIHYPIAPFDFIVGLNNGWDTVDDVNDGKTIETRVGLNLEKFSIGVVGYFGPEEMNVDGDWRELIDIVATFTPIENLIFVANFDFGWQQDVNMINPVTGEQFEENVSWWGGAGYIVYDFSEIVRFALRGEYFDDPEGFRTGTAQKLWELTPTLQLRPFAKYSPFDNFLLRLEYRHDQSDEDVFVDDDGGLKKTQDTVALELLYWFTL